MTLQIVLASATGAALPPGAPLSVELRDTSLQDTTAVLLKRVLTSVPQTGITHSLAVSMDVATVPDGATVWAHLDVDGDGRVSPGDLISTESYPVTPASRQALTIRLTKVR